MWKVIKDYPNVLQNFFFNQFSDSIQWFEASQNFVKTCAVWSCFCYIIGLGDRHSDNILFQIPNGRILHVDFDCIFEKGKILPTPEIVYFRLTKNIEAAFGALKAHGLFKYYFIEASKIFKSNMNLIIGALSSFIYDPLVNSSPSSTSTQHPRLPCPLPFWQAPLCKSTMQAPALPLRGK